MQLFPIEAHSSNYCGDQIEDTLLPLHFSRAHFFPRAIVPHVGRRASPGADPSVISDRSETEFCSRDHRGSGRKTYPAVSIMAKSLLYFSAGVSGESRPPLALALARDDGRGLCRNVEARCNIVYEKDPANGRARAVNPTACGCWLPYPLSHRTIASARRENGPVAGL